MPESVIQSIEKMREAFKKVPRGEAEKIAAEAAIRAEAVADYVERQGGKDNETDA